MKSRAFLSLILFSILLPACRKMTPEPSSSPLCFTVSASGMQTKAVTNKAMGPTYDTGETFSVYAAYSESSFDAGNSSSYTAFWDGALICRYNSTYNAWSPETTYYWPRAGFLTFQAYSPSDASPAPTFGWPNGFTFTDFTIPAAGSQYDLLYTDRIENLQRSQYTVTEGDVYDDDSNSEFIYNGINLPFHHALSLIEVQAVSALGSHSSTKYYVQKIELKNAYDQGTFTSNDGQWVVNTTPSKVNYTIVDKGAEWQLLRGADEYQESINPNLTLILLPQTLNRDSAPEINEETDAYLNVVYKDSIHDTPQTVRIPLTEPWVKGMKYTYRLVFSEYIEFQATITEWKDPVRGKHVIVI